jgi:hypothetical protein
LFLEKETSLKNKGIILPVSSPVITIVNEESDVSGSSSVAFVTYNVQISAELPGKQI